MRVALTHVIEERYDRPVRLSTHWLRLRPTAHARADVTAYSLRVHTQPHFVNWMRDAFQNHVARVDFPEPVRRLAIEVDLVVDLADGDPFDFLIDDDAVEHPFDYAPQLRRELAPYLEREPAGRRLAHWLAGLPRGRAAAVERVRRVMAAVHDEVAVETTGPCDPESVLALRAGPPAALAWLAVVGLRALGFAARFTSGYRVVPGDGCVAATPHAWAEVFLPGAGWIGTDPASGLFTSAAWLPLACAPDPTKARAVAGFREACSHEDVETLRARVLEPMPLPAPYTNAEWAAIGAAGRRVDADLAAAGVSLAVGRELAFASVPHGGAPEWRTTALGPSKLPAAEALLAALRDRLAPGGVASLGHGEWFAGEPCPRWRLACVWRADGRPVWRCSTSAGAASPESMKRFSRALARTLGVGDEKLIAAHDDPLADARADDPPPIDDLLDPDRRRALTDRLSEERAGPLVGWVLPIAWDHAAECWRSGTWTFRRRRLYLLPGTLAMGVRLPLASLPPDDAADTRDPERSLFAPVGPLPESWDAPGPAVDDGPAPRTAVCVELRDGALRVFLPPLGRAEAYLRLVAAVAAAAADADVAVALEGYEAPEDVRLRRIVFEPAPGVLRVALPLVADTTEQVALLDAVYAEAARLGLRAERATADGVPEPLGACAPIVLGGTTPDASPFLRRPELLRALLACWQRHPSLSYLFRPSELVGPGGPAPRADEGRPGALAELAIALDRIPGGEAYPPWIGDRLLRHLLADASGDGRRTEVCTERLYDPAHAARRRGEIALASFAAPPCARTAAVQSLLVAALVARFARRPEAVERTAWDGALHDRFMLPAVLRADFDAVLAELASAGHRLDAAWFAPFLDAHFPLLGRVQLGDVSLELRAAHEPWPVLAEEATGAGMARFVDSANGRVEARLVGSSPRHVLACNGRRVPLRPAGSNGTVAGVRYKRWNPPATLHPTTWPVGELVFDVVDVWTGRAIGGCRYVPAVPELTGAVAMPAMAATPGERPRLLPPVAPVPPRSGRGWFRAGGSGLRPMAPPPDGHGAGWTLDLTEPA